MSTSRNWEEYIHKKNSGHKNPTSHMRRYSRRPRDMEDVSGSTRGAEQDSIIIGPDVVKGACCVDRWCMYRCYGSDYGTDPSGPRYNCHMTTEEWCESYGQRGCGAKCGTWNATRNCSNQGEAPWLGGWGCPETGACCSKDENGFEDTIFPEVPYEGHQHPWCWPMSPTGCQLKNGEYQGNGTVCEGQCDPPPEPQKEGACCLPDLCFEGLPADSSRPGFGSVAPCKMLVWWVCMAYGGTWYEDQECTDSPHCYPQEACGRWYHKPEEHGWGGSSG